MDTIQVVEEYDSVELSRLNTDDYVITTFRQQPLHFQVRQAADWYYDINRGFLEVGAFYSEAEAIAHARKSILDYYRDLGRSVHSIIVNGTATHDPD